jgi:hypothetical protein
MGYLFYMILHRRGRLEFHVGTNSYAHELMTAVSLQQSISLDDPELAATVAEWRRDIKTHAMEEVTL